MKNEEIYKTWTEFINDKKYKKYFSVNESDNTPSSIEPSKNQPSTSIKINRPEQSKLRKYLIDNKEHKCIICKIDKPVKLLQCAHLNPHCDIDDTTKYDNNIVEFMCFKCHKLYDDGDVSIDNGYLVIKDINEYPQYTDLQNKKIECYNNKNKQYFDYHFQNIYTN